MQNDKLFELCEPVAIPDTFVTGVGYVEEVSPNLYRVALCTEVRLPHANERSRDVDAKLIMSGEVLAEISQAMMQGIDVRPELLTIAPNATAN